MHIGNTLAARGLELEEPCASFPDFCDNHQFHVNFEEFLIHYSRGFMILKNTNLLGLCHFRLIISKRVQRGTILICRHGQINPVELQQELVKKYLLLYQESQA